MKTDFRWAETLKIATPSVEEEIRQRLDAEEILPDRIAAGLRYAKELAEGYAPLTAPGWVSEKVGFGLFAEESIEPDTFIGEYTGLIRKNDLYEPLNGYLYRYPVLDRLGKHFVIDAQDYGNHTRLINHSFQPNLKCIWGFHGGLYHMILIALKPIAKGDQLCYNYGSSYWTVRGPPEPV